ncbi:hypothetical protein [Microvirga antarctica]|uniref:hypothetical protein n=1 Tax=Microvirga antarctica TaxID=2819233 RepID=UPI001B314782|nr:hypothetical protein [Microvirga antarctica]
MRTDVGGIADAAVSQGRHFIDAAKEQATDYAGKRKADVAQSVADLATSLRSSTSSFDERPNIQAVVDSAAEGLEQLADSIRERTFSEIFSDVEAVVRRRPMAFGIASLAVGFVAARFIKSTSEDLRDEQDDLEALRPRRTVPARPRA